MKRVVARFADADDAAAAERELRAAGLAPERPDFENPFFDPTARIPEERTVVAGALVGGLVGLVVLSAIDADVLWIPRTSPLMSAGEFAVPVLGLGLGLAVGGFVGGVVGTLRPVPESEAPAVAVRAPDHRVGEVADLLREHDATRVAGRVTYHEHPGPAGGE